MNNRIVVFPNISVVFFIIFVAFSIIYTGFPGCICRYGKSFTETKRRSEINFTSPAESSFLLWSAIAYSVSYHSAHLLRRWRYAWNGLLRLYTAQKRNLTGW